MRQTPPAGGGGTKCQKGNKVASRSDDGEGEDAYNIKTCFFL